MDNHLQKIVQEIAEAERIRKKPKLRETIVKIVKTKNGNLMFILEDERRLLVNKNSGLFKMAQNIMKGDQVYAEGEKGINILFCDKLKVLNRIVDVNQEKLGSY